jgi:hypothetical protein
MSLEGLGLAIGGGWLAARRRSESIIESMVIDMNEAQVRTLEQVRQVLAGTQAMEFQAAADDEGRYAWIESVLRRLEYRQLHRADRGPVLAYLQRLSGYSRAQITRLVSRGDAGKPLVKNYGAPRHPFARLYTPADGVRQVLPRAARGDHRQRREPFPAPPQGGTLVRGGHARTGAADEVDLQLDRPWN